MMRLHLSVMHSFRAINNGVIITSMHTSFLIASSLLFLVRLQAIELQRSGMQRSGKDISYSYLVFKKKNIVDTLFMSEIENVGSFMVTARPDPGNYFIFNSIAGVCSTAPHAGLAISHVVMKAKYLKEVLHEITLEVFEDKNNIVSIEPPPQLIDECISCGFCFIKNILDATKLYCNKEDLVIKNPRPIAVRGAQPHPN